MPNRLILEIGQASIEVPIKGNVTTIREAVRRYLATEGVDMTGMTQAQVAQAALRRLLRTIAIASRERQRGELLDAQRAQLEETLNADNDLVDGL